MTNEKFKAWYQTLPLYTEGMEIRCPLHNSDGTVIDEDDIKGCGSTDLEWDDDVYDCNECGIFFADYAAEPPHQRCKK
jgi:hypothetical protein